MVGYDTVVKLAHKAGINEDVQATPAMAIGSYDATPLEMAGAYTVFANSGVHVQPSFIALVQGADGKVISRAEAGHQPGARSARQLPDGQYAGRGDAHRHGGGRRSRGFTAARGGKDGNVARRLVRRLHVRTFFASCGWASTITANSIWKARIPRCRSGPNS